MKAGDFDNIPNLLILQDGNYEKCPKCNTMAQNPVFEDRGLPFEVAVCPYCASLLVNNKPISKEQWQRVEGTVYEKALKQIHDEITREICPND